MESTGRKIWNVIYPVLVLLALYFGVVYGGILIISSVSGSGSVDSAMDRNFALITVIALVLVIVIEYLFFRNDRPVQSARLTENPFRIPGILILGAAFSHGLSLLLSLLLSSETIGDYEAVQESIFAPGVVFVLIRVLVLAPLAEELVFRGLVFRRLKNYTNFWVGALVSAALFGLYHMNLAQGIMGFFFGILLAAVYQKMENLWAPVLVHFAANLLSVILTYTKAEYPNMIVYILVMIVMFALSAALYFLWIRRIPEKEKEGISGEE